MEKTSLSKAVWKAFYDDGGEQVFSALLFDGGTVKKKNIRSPVSGDRNPSFSVSPNTNKNSSYYWCYSDFSNQGAKHAKGNAIDLIKYVGSLRGQNFEDKAALEEELARIYGLAMGMNQAVSSSVAYSGKDVSSSCRNWRNKKSNTLEYRKIDKIEFKKELDPEEKQFWQQKLSLSEKRLERLLQEHPGIFKSVASFSTVKVKASVKTGKQFWESKPRESVNLKHCYAFEILENEAYKLYMPHPAYRFYGKAKSVFLPNLDHTIKQVEPDYFYNQGLDELKPAEPAYLVGGEADYLALKARGKNVFTLGSEIASLPEQVIERLKEKETSQLKIIFDTDFTGMSSAYQLKAQLIELNTSEELKLEVETVTLPGLATQLYKQKKDGSFRYYKSRDEVLTEADLPETFNPEKWPYQKPQENDICDYLAIQQEKDKKTQRPSTNTLPAKKKRVNSGRGANIYQSA